MYVTFEKTFLKDLYETGQTADKNHRYQPDIVKRYQKCVKLQWSAGRIEDLKQTNSLNTPCFSRLF